MSGKGISLFHSLWKKVSGTIKPVDGSSVDLPSGSSQSGSNLLDNTNLAANGGTITEDNRTNVFGAIQRISGDQTASVIELDNTSTNGKRWTIRSLNNGNVQLFADSGISGAEMVLLESGGFQFRDNSNNQALEMDGNGLLKVLQDLLKAEQGLGLVDLSSDPTDPSTGESVMWQTDGSSGTSGADGDIMMKVTDSSGTTKTITLIDFSAN